MGLMDRLRGKSGGKIQVYVEPLEAGPGSEMAVRFIVVDGLDDKARSVLDRRLRDDKAIESPLIVV